MLEYRIGLDSLDLGQMVEVLVAGEEWQVMLDAESGDPEIVFWNRFTYFAQVGFERRVMFGCRFVNYEQLARGESQEIGKQFETLLLPGASINPIFILPCHYNRNIDSLSQRDHPNRRLVVLEKI